MQVVDHKHRLQQRAASVLLWAVFGVGLCVVIGIGVWRFAMPPSALEAVLQPLGTVPDFMLQERSGVAITKNDLLGKIWVVGFIYTQCAEECPLMSNRMARLQETYATAPDFRLVSITVDPEHDTPAVLSQYASGFGAHPQRWLFLTGDKATILHLAREGFHLGVLESRAAPPLRPVWFARLFAHGWEQVWGLLAPSVSWAHHAGDDQNKAPQAVLHSARLVVVDRQGQIRHYYDSRDEDVMSRLQQHVLHLLRH